MAFNTNDEQACDEAGVRKDLEFRPPSGTTVVRVLPTWKGPETPMPRYYWREFREHFLQVGESTWVFPSPREFGLPDPVWDKADELFATKNPELAVVAQKLVPKRKFLFNVVVLSCPEMKNKPKIGEVTIMKVGKMVWEPINKLNSNRTSPFHTLTLPENGVNLAITSEGSLLNTRYTTLPAGGRSDLIQDLAALSITTTLEELSDGVVNLDEYVEANQLRDDQIESTLAQYLRIHGVQGEPEIVVPKGQVAEVVPAAPAPKEVPPVAPTVVPPPPPPVMDGLVPPPPPPNFGGESA